MIVEHVLVHANVIMLVVVNPDGLRSTVSIDWSVYYRNNLKIGFTIELSISRRVQYYLSSNSMRFVLGRQNQLIFDRKVGILLAESRSTPYARLNKTVT